MSSGIYRIINNNTNKVYIGSSVNIDGRWRSHRKELRNGSHHSVYLQRSWNKHGENNFIFKIIETVEPTKVTLLEREQYWMDYYKCYNKKYGYNINPTAGSPLGYKWTEGRKQKRMGHIVSEETRKKISISNSGKHKTLKQRKALSIIVKIDIYNLILSTHYLEKPVVCHQNMAPLNLFVNMVTVELKTI